MHCGQSGGPITNCANKITHTKCSCWAGWFLFLVICVCDGWVVWLLCWMPFVSYFVGLIGTVAKSYNNGIFVKLLR